MHRHTRRCRQVPATQLCYTPGDRAGLQAPIHSNVEVRAQVPHTLIEGEEKREEYINRYAQDRGCKGASVRAFPLQTTVQFPQAHWRGKQHTPIHAHLEEAQVVFLQLDSEGGEEGTAEEASSRVKEKERELVCVEQEAESLPHTEMRAEWRGKVHPCSDTEERQGRQKGTPQPEHLALSDTGRRTKREQCSSTTHLSRSLFLLKDIFSHLQGHLCTKLHSPVSQALHACLCSVTALSAPHPVHAALSRFSARQWYFYTHIPLRSTLLHTFTTCSSPLVLSRLWIPLICSPIFLFVEAKWDLPLSVLQPSNSFHLLLR